MNMPLIITGTPSKAWFEPSLALSESLNRADQDRFRQFFDDNFGPDTHESSLIGKFSLNQQPHFIKKIGASWSGFSYPSAKEVLADLRACLLGKVLLSNEKKTQVLAFYSSPEDYLANLPGESDPIQALEVWKESARCLLDLIRSHRSSITLLSAEECMSASEPLKTLLHEKYAIDSWEMPSRPAVDPVRLALGKMQAESDYYVASLFSELDAASHPLAGDAPPRWNTNELIKMAWGHISSVAGVLCKEAKEEKELLLQQLHKVQEELESLHLQSKAFQVEVEKSKKSQEAAKKEYDEKIQDERRQKQGLENQLRELKKSLSAAEATANTLKGLENKHKEAEEENELLLLQLHQVQEELEHYFLENRRLDKERLGASGLGASLLQVEGLRMGHCHDVSPHRHLDFTLDQARLGERDLGSARLRMVEHNGRPGLLVFQGYSKDSAPLYHWKSSGEENGSPFMLIVPQDDSGRDALVAAPTSDLLFLRESARLLAGELHAAIQNGSSQRKRDWARIAKRFIDLADDIPQRLHYDDVVARGLEDKAHQFILRNAWTAYSGLIRSLEFQWKDFTIELLPPADAELPLTNWPLDEKTRAHISLTLDLSPRSDWTQTRKAWSGLTASDRAFLLLLIAELPNFARHLAVQHPELKPVQEALLKQAKTMLARAQALATGRKPKRLLGIIPI